jgi:hypothetical protein
MDRKYYKLYLVILSNGNSMRSRIISALKYQQNLAISNNLKKLEERMYTKDLTFPGAVKAQDSATLCGVLYPWCLGFFFFLDLVDTSLPSYNNCLSKSTVDSISAFFLEKDPPCNEF